LLRGAFIRRASWSREAYTTCCVMYGNRHERIPKTVMRLRWLGHSCIEIVGHHHILIDPDFYRPPGPGVEYIFITHGHEDHLGCVGQLSSGLVLASRDVCETILADGVSPKRLCAVEPGDVVENVRVLPGYSPTGWLTEQIARVWQHRHRLPGGTPLSFLVENDLSLLHIGDGHRVPDGARPDILCLPWRRVPLWSEYYQKRLVNLTEQLAPRYIIPIHYDISPWEADPMDLEGRVKGEVVVPREWVILS